MKNLVINNGSTSIRFSLFEDDNLLVEGKIENLNTFNSYIKINSNTLNIKENKKINSIEDALNIMEKVLINYNYIENNKDINSISIRIISGGNIFKENTIINENNINDILKLEPFMPLHYKNIIKTIKYCRSNFKDSYLIGIFDNIFHNTIKEENSLYTLPKEICEEYGIKRYGYHGISYESVLNRFIEENNLIKDNVNSIICHLGGGSSICNIKNGKSFYTTMGFSPNSGLIMATRTGDIDPNIILYLIEKGYSIEELKEIINNKSGYFGVSSSKDMKQIVDESNIDENKKLLRKIIENDFKKNLLGTMSINYPNEIIITGGIGLKNKEQREMLFRNLENFNIEIDKEKNNSLFDEDGIISKDKSIPIYVIKDNEEIEINKQGNKVLRKEMIK